MENRERCLPDVYQERRISKVRHLAMGIQKLPKQLMVGGQFGNSILWLFRSTAVIYTEDATGRDPEAMKVSLADNHGYTMAELLIQLTQASNTHTALRQGKIP